MQKNLGVSVNDSVGIGENITPDKVIKFNVIALLLDNTIIRRQFVRKDKQPMEVPRGKAVDLTYHIEVK